MFMRASLVSIAAATLIIMTVSLGSPAVSVAAPTAQNSPADDNFTLPAPKAGRPKPLVVVVAEAAGAETTDFIVPYGVLKESGIAEVRSLSTGAGAIKLTRGLTIMADQTLARFDAEEPAGADIVIVPAQASPKDAGLAKWLRAQADKGATIISVCEGARVLANARLLAGKRAVTHFSAIDKLAKAYPDTIWVRDRRYLQDGAIISTTGVTASIPMSLALVEAIGGHDVATATARRFGVDSWSSEHRTADFVLGKQDIVAAMLAMSEVWTHETVELPLEEGIDEVAVALRADAWGRTYRTTVASTNAGSAPVRSRHGLLIVPDAQPQPGRYVLGTVGIPAVAQLDDALAGIGKRYGPGATRLVTLGMEYDPPAGAGR
jgi:putative intracellular protease/amidase